MGAVSFLLGDLRHDQNVPGLDLARLYPLHLDHVVAEWRLDRIGDHAGLERERDPLELGHHCSTPEPVE